MQNKNRTKWNTGFTLVEMLIVVAIIAILVAVSIPLVSSSLENARDNTDKANERAAKTAAMMAYLGAAKIYKPDDTVYDDYAPGTDIADGTDFGSFLNAGVYYDAENGRLVAIIELQELEKKPITPYGKCSQKHPTAIFASGGRGPHNLTEVGGIIRITITSGVVEVKWLNDYTDDGRDDIGGPGGGPENPNFWDMVYSDWFDDIVTDPDGGLFMMITNVLSEEELNAYLKQLYAECGPEPTTEEAQAHLDTYFATVQGNYPGIVWLNSNPSSLAWGVLCDFQLGGFVFLRDSLAPLSTGESQMEKFNHDLVDLIGADALPDQGLKISSEKLGELESTWGIPSMWFEYWLEFYYDDDSYTEDDDGYIYFGSIEEEDNTGN